MLADLIYCVPLHCYIKGRSQRKHGDPSCMEHVEIVGFIVIRVLKITIKSK